MEATCVVVSEQGLSYWLLGSYQDLVYLDPLSICLCGSELAKLIFPFFWKGKRDLMARVVVTQPPTAGGFSVVDIKLKVASLLVQWLLRYASSPSGWVTLFSYWVSVQFMPLLTLSWPTRLLFILAFCPLSIVLCCLPGGKSKDRILNAAPLLSLLFTFPSSLLTCC